MRFAPKNDLAYSLAQLQRFLSSRRLWFNPYKVSDSQLIEYAWQGRWGDLYDLTQMVIMTFTRLKLQKFGDGIEGIYMRVGCDEEELFISRSVMIRRITAHDTLQGIHHLYGKAPVRNDDELRRLVGKTVFVSRTIHGCRIVGGAYCAVYRMHKITGNQARDAKTIRQAMCEAKIEMLERLLNNPESQWYLNCSKGFFDYATPIRALMARIALYPQTPIPQ